MGRDAMHISEGSFRCRSPCVSRGLWHSVHHYASSELPKTLKLYFCMQTEGWVQGRRSIISNGQCHWCLNGSLILVQIHVALWGTLQSARPRNISIPVDTIVIFHQIRYGVSTTSGLLLPTPWHSYLVVFSRFSSQQIQRMAPKVKCLQTRNLSAYYANQPMVNIQQSRWSG